MSAARTREHQVLRLLEGGASYREAAEALGTTRNAIAGLAFRAIPVKREAASAMQRTRRSRREGAETRRPRS